MARIGDALFRDVVWQQALEKFAAVTRLTVVVYGVDAAVVSGPIHPSPRFALFEKAGYELGIFAECGRRCLALDRPAISLVSSYGLAGWAPRWCSRGFLVEHGRSGSATATSGKHRGCCACSGFGNFQQHQFLGP